MAEEQDLDALRASLALRRERADQEAQTHAAPSWPTAAQLLHSRPVECALEHPLLTGLAVGIIVLIGPLRLARFALAGLGVAQTVLSLHAAYRGEDDDTTPRT